MKVNMIAFGDSSAPYYNKITEVMRRGFAGVYEDVEPPEVFASVRAGLPSVAAAVESGELIIIAAADSLYYETKRTIAKAFRFNLVQDEDIAHRLLKLKNGERFLLQALVPENSTPFSLSDGLYPGFAIRSHEQCIIFLSLSPERTLLTLNNFVFPYIEAVYGIKTGRFAETEAAYGVDMFLDSARETGAQIAIANTPFCKYIAHATKKTDEFADYAAYAPYDEKKTDNDSSDLSADIARDYYNTPYGVSVIRSDSEDGVISETITIALGAQAVIRTISSLPDETEDDFMNFVVMELFCMLADMITTELPEEYKTAAGRKKSLKKQGRKFPVALIILLILVFLVVFAATYVLKSAFGDTIAELFRDALSFVKGG